MAFSDNKDASVPSHASDDLSLFLRQLLHHSSSSSAAPQPSGIDGQIRLSGRSGVAISDPERPMADRTRDASNAGLSYWNSAAAGVSANLTPSSAAPVESDSLTAGSVQLRSTDNDTDEYDCESEEGPEGGLLEAQLKRSLSRNSSKRSRAAEVHNLSEKRRRSRINEKMKALQNLIPNSNKTDKASMLDEAIEYLKQLQLQVQMLSMRNGMILNPMCMPGYPGVLNPVQLSQLGLSTGDGGESLNANIPNTLHSDQTRQCDPFTRPSLDPLSSMTNTEAPFTMESTTPNQLSSFHLLTSSQNICSEDRPPQHCQSALNDSQANALEFESEPSTSVSIPVSNFAAQPSYTKNEAHRALQGSSTDPLRLLSSNLDGLYPRTTSSSLATLDQKADIF